MSGLYLPERQAVKPSCAPEGWQPPKAGYDDEEPRRPSALDRPAMTYILRRARRKGEQ